MSELNCMGVLEIGCGARQTSRVCYRYMCVGSRRPAGHDRPAMDENDKLWCTEIMSRIVSWPIALPFMRPVDPDADGAPDYYERVTHPMDLEKIGGRVEGDKYKSPKDFIADIQLMYMSRPRFTCLILLSIFSIANVMHLMDCLRCIV